MRSENTHLTLQIKSGSVRICAFGPQLRRKRSEGLEYAPALSSTHRYYTRAELLGRVWRRGEYRGIVVDPRIDEQHAALRAACASASVSIIGAEAVDAAGFDVDARDLGPVVCGEDRELDRAAPGIRGENCADVFVAWTPFFFVTEPPNQSAKRKVCGASNGR